MLKPNTVSQANNDMFDASTSQVNQSASPSPYTMTEAILQERLKHENRGRYITQLCVAITVSLAALSFGTVLGWSSPVTRYLMTNKLKYYNLTEDHYGWVVSLMPLGCSIGVPVWSYTINKVGPKHALIMQIPFYIPVFLLVLTVKTYDMYLAVRFFTGFLSIVNIIGGECLLIDSVHRGNLPHMLLFFRSSVMLGVLSSYLIGHFSSNYWMVVICITVPTFNAIILLFLPESPVFLYKRSEKRAEEALIWYRGRENISTELRSIRKDAEVHKIGAESERYMLFSKVVMKALLIVLGLTFFQVFSGYYAFIFYNLMLWKYTIVDPFTDALIFGVCLYLSSFIGTIVHNNIRLGVRKPLLVSTSLTAASLTLLFICLFLIQRQFICVETQGWISLAALNSFVISYEIGLSTYADTLLSDYLPYQIHDTAKTITNICIWVQIFLLTKYIFTLRTHTTYYMPFAVLAVIQYIAILYCYVFIIETKGKNLIQIQIEIGGNPIGNRGAYRNRLSAAGLTRVY